MHSYIPTHHCNALTLQDRDQEVTLSGWVHRRRDHGGVLFIDLRDRFGITQLVFHAGRISSQETDPIRQEWVISVQGVVRPRGQDMTNPKLTTGEIEVDVMQLRILSPAIPPPFSICDDTTVYEELRLKYRYLDMRRPGILQRLVLRHRVFLHCRNFLDRLGFTEIQTPILAKSSPEGARDYVVPSRIYPGTFYALPQAPQLFKQLLMIGSLDKYFQFAPCFRDEDLRADRQPEFTQLDIEMSFSSPEYLFGIIESLFSDLFTTLFHTEISIPFPRMTYADAMEHYGSDKPDTRFEMRLVNITALMKSSNFTLFTDQIKQGGIVKALCVKQGAALPRKTIDDYVVFAQKLGLPGLSWMKTSVEGLHSNIAKFFTTEILSQLQRLMNAEPGDLVFIAAADRVLVNKGLDHLRRAIAKDQNLVTSPYQFLWVTHFPLFAKESTGMLTSEHHPFTAPVQEDLPLLTTDPLKVRASSYDLVLNGYELASGSERIFDSALQEKIFEILQLSKEERAHRFGFFLEALQYGTPPHMGMALGMDRVMMILSGTQNIRDVIAFPKTQKATDLMMESPSTITEELLKELHLKLQP